jgi:hypothetical protein
MGYGLRTHKKTRVFIDGSDGVEGEGGRKRKEGVWGNNGCIANALGGTVNEKQNN